MRSGPRSVVLGSDRAGVDPVHGGERREVAVVDRGDVDGVAGHAHADGGEAGQDLPLARPVGGRREDGGRPLAGAPDGPEPDHVVEVRLLERGEPGQDDVGVARRLVHPVVDADHALEVRERGVERGRRRGR